jgi:hypothetical protein
LKGISLEKGHGDIVRIPTKKRSCKIIKNIIDKEGEKNE